MLLLLKRLEIDKYNYFLCIFFQSQMAFFYLLSRIYDDIWEYLPSQRKIKV